MDPSTPNRGRRGRIERGRAPVIAAAMAALALTAAAGCSPTVDTRGNLPLTEVVDEIKPGKQTRAQVASMLGSPSTTATFEQQEVWYYIGKRTQKIAFFTPKLLERKVLVVSFDKQGVVRAVRRLDSSDGKPVTLVERVTPTKGKELGILEQIIGNVGRFSRPDDDD